MNTHDIDIELPPLPEWVDWPVTVSEMSASEVKEAMQDYARAAVEADRKRRGEPVDLDRYDAGLLGGQDGMPAYVWHDIIRAELDRAYDFYMVQLDRAAPQPAEPVKVPSDVDILELWSGDPTHSRPVMGKNKVLAFARALLARYDRGASMTTETDLLPMPEGEAIGVIQAWSRDQMRDYARATATLQAEIEALKGTIAALEANRQRRGEPVKEPRLYQHTDGRYGLSFGSAKFAQGEPAWYSVPIDVYEDEGR